MDISDLGYQTFAPVLQPGECDDLIAQLAGVAGCAGTRHLMSHGAVSQLANDPRLVRIAQTALGEHAVPFRATLFAKSGAANWLIPWHQDTALPLTAAFNNPEWASWSEKAGIPYAHAPAWALARVVALRVHLDESTTANRPLRVIKGSHLTGILSDDGVQDYVQSNEQTTCLVPRSGILAMRPLLIQASSKAETNAPRRVLHIEYADTLELQPGIRLAVA